MSIVMCMQNFIKIFKNIVFVSDSAVTQQVLDNPVNTNAVILGLSVAVGILALVAITAVVGIVLLWKRRYSNILFTATL